MIAVGQTIGNYTITAKLGEGGMGVVYLAEHPVIGRKAALKAIHPELSRNPEVVSRFVTEAKSVNQIGNEHIVDIHDFGTTSDGEFYFIMEFLQGEALSDRLKRESVLPVPQALHIGAQVADALAASHAHGIIHRDLKPENIFLIPRGSTADFVKVLDFGLAKLTLGEEKVTHKTRTGSVMGTPYYMSPEQCEGKANIDHRSDLYALGIILFEMMTGRVPFGGDGYGEIIVKHITQPPPSPRAINPMLSPAHEAVLMRALAKGREERFQSMEEFRAAMLDPEGYAASAPVVSFAHLLGAAPRVTGAVPLTYADHEVSGQVVFGGSGGPGSGGHPALGARSAPMPTTFRHGTGELLDEAAGRRSRRGLYAGLVLAGLGAAGAAVFFGMQGRISGPPAQSVASPAPPPAAAVPPAAVVPPAPEKVTIMFRSEPTGASVFRKGEESAIGTTPLDVEVPYGKVAVDFVVKKARFEDVPLSFVPEGSALIPVRLTPEEEAEPPQKSARAASKPKPAKPNKPKKATRPMPDEDSPLEPSFLK